MKKRKYNDNKKVENGFKKHSFFTILTELILTITNLEFLIGLILFGVLGLFFGSNYIYQSFLGVIMLMYILPIILFFANDIFSIEDFFIIRRNEKEKNSRNKKKTNKKRDKIENKVNKLKKDKIKKSSPKKDIIDIFDMDKSLTSTSLGFQNKKPIKAKKSGKSKKLINSKISNSSSFNKASSLTKKRKKIKKNSLSSRTRKKF